MRCRSPWTAAAGLTFAIAILGTQVVDAEDAPAPAPEPSADAARANALDKQVERLDRDGKLAEAVPLARESLALREQAFGKDHASVAVSLNNLGGVLEPVNGPLRRRAAAVSPRPGDQGEGARGRASGYRHRASTTSPASTGRWAARRRAAAVSRAPWRSRRRRSGRASGYAPPASTTSAPRSASQMGRYDDARRCSNAPWRSMRRRSADRLRVAADLNNLADLSAIGRATPRRGPSTSAPWRSARRALGKDHPEVAAGLNNLAVLLKTKGRYAEALPL